MRDTNAETFNAREYVEGLVRFIATGPEEQRQARRIAITKRDPLAFALVYLKHHLKDDATGGRITFSDAHLEWAERARAWTSKPTEAKESRHAEVAPRETGKTTWWFLLLPMWAAAHGHIKFIAAFADTSTQAELHLATFKRELEKNTLIRADYPELVAPEIRGRGVLASDNRGLYIAKSEFAFMAKGIDSGTLGAKIGERRPDLLLLDDIEPKEGSYSLETMRKRLGTIIDAILPLSFMARLVIVGTVVMPGSIIHQLVKSAAGEEEEGEEWVREEKIVTHHYKPILRRDDGTERSIWPAKWSMAFLESIRHLKSFAKNFANDPMGADGDYWTKDDFLVGQIEGTTRTLLSIDPAVTTKRSSDFTGLAVIGWSPYERKCQVKTARAVKLAPAFLRTYVLKMIEEDPTIGLILIETNQGGDAWKAILHSMPVPVATKHQDVPKEVRAASVYNHYQRKEVVHSLGLIALEQQMVAFPGAPNDDMVDAVGTGIAYFLDRKRAPRPAPRSESYL